jgi:sulfur carrier protein
MMKLFINGKEEQASDDLTVVQLLKEKNVEMPDMVTVELNGKILKREQFETTKVKENDKVEFLYFMGGGAQ